MIFHDYIIVGAGPAGLQMGYLLDAAGRDYLILEGHERVGTFFEKFPRRLNSFNKTFNWFSEPEFNLRFDWHSLLTHDYSLQNGGGGEARFRLPATRKRCDRRIMMIITQTSSFFIRGATA